MLLKNIPAMRNRLYPLLLALLIPHAGFAQYTKFAADAVKADFEALYPALQQTHYNLYAYTDRTTYDAHFRQLKERIKGDSLSYIETVSLFQHLVSLANTGHCEIDFPAKGYIEYAYTGGKLFPLELALEAGKAFVRKNFSDNTQIAAGDEVLAVDGVPVDRIIRKMYPLVSAEREYFKKVKIEFWSFPRLLFQLEGKKESWNITLKKATTAQQVSLKGISVMQYEEQRKGEILNPVRQFRFYGKTAYLNPGLMNSLEPSDEAGFRSFADSAFAVLQQQNAQNLVVDLRNNPGGHDSYSDYLVRYFATQPFHWSSNFRIKISKQLQDQTRKRQDTTDYYTRTILGHRAGSIVNYELPLQQPFDKGRQFKGRVYVLVNRQTYSMAVVCAALVQDYHFATIVGEETGDVPTLYASQFSFDLPRTGITIKVPKGYIIRPNGDERLAGLQPDIVIKDHLLDDRDEIMEGLLEHLK
ncbi:S41 family peptidase [Taibaiella chishuiensis]|nr:S41 family peptidase [Taibaiella chishuiensis]